MLILFITLYSSRPRDISSSASYFPSIISDSSFLKKVNKITYDIIEDKLGTNLTLLSFSNFNFLKIVYFTKGITSINFL